MQEKFFKLKDIFKIPNEKVWEIKSLRFLEMGGEWGWRKNNHNFKGVFPKLSEPRQIKPKSKISRHTNQFLFIFFGKENFDSFEKRNFDSLEKKILTVWKRKF